MSNNEWNAGGAGAQAQGVQQEKWVDHGGAGRERPHRSPALAGWLSLLPGLGHVYVGYYQQGFINVAIFAGIIVALASHNLDSLKPALGVGQAFFVFYNIIDANRRAHHYNRVAAGLGAEALPEDFKMPTSRGSLFGGLVLIGVGLLFLLDLNFDIPLDWLEDWWPLFLVLFGVRLVWQARRKAK